MDDRLVASGPLVLMACCSDTTQRLFLLLLLLLVVVVGGGGGFATACNIIKRGLLQGNEYKILPLIALSLSLFSLSLSLSSLSLSLLLFFDVSEWKRIKFSYPSRAVVFLSIFVINFELKDRIEKKGRNSKQFQTKDSSSLSLSLSVTLSLSFIFLKIL